MYIFYMTGTLETGESYGKYLFIIDESGDVLTGGQPSMGIFFDLIITVRMQQRGRGRM